MTASRPTLRERLPDPLLFRVYATVIVLAVAYGLAIALTPIVLEHRAFTGTQIGGLASWFGLGIVSFALPAGTLVRRFGKGRVIAIAIAGYAAMIGAFPFLPSFGAIAACRFVDGACSVCAWVGCETLLLERAPPSQKAFATSLYALSTAAGYVIGPTIAWLLRHTLSAENTFVVAGAIAFVASIYAAFALRKAGPSEEVGDTAEVASEGSLVALAARIRMPAAATFAMGFFQASAVLFLPLFLQSEKHIAEDDTRLVVAFTAAGMVVFANPAGRLGDRMGHLAVLRLQALAGVIGLGALWLIEGIVPIGLAIFLGGGAVAAMPPLSLALQGVITRPGEYARANSIFNFFFAAGLLSGPLVSGFAFERWGGHALLALLVGLWATFALLSLVFRRDDPRVQSTR